MPTTAHDHPVYRNPILDEDRPDPDAIRVGDDYFLVTSSFNRSPGLPVLTSSDLVNWRILTHALEGNTPDEWFSLPRHGSGVWAPSIRHRNGTFHIVYPDPDQGIFVVSATDAAGPWSEPRLLLRGSGIIDPCPLWDDDGRAYLVHGWARSRAGMKNQLWVAPVDPELTTTIGASRLVIDGNAIPECGTLEGPKFYRHGGWYWIFAPAGGVATGWQSAFRSRDPYGPYEHRVVLEQGSTAVNGPHQGAWVDTPDGSDWFLHFQDRGVFGRVLHLQPMAWGEDGWPLMGKAVAGGPAEPVEAHPSPFGTSQGTRTLAHADDFHTRPGPNWTWQANRQSDRAGSGDGLRMTAAAEDGGNLRTLSAVMGQPLPGLSGVTFEVSVEITGSPGTRAGLAVLGLDYVWAGLRTATDGPRIVVATRADGDAHETVHVDRPATSSAIRLRMRTDAGGNVSVSVRDAEGWTTAAGLAHPATKGQWIGAEIALFAASPLGGNAGEATFRGFRIAEVDTDAKAEA